MTQTARLQKGSVETSWTIAQNFDVTPKAAVVTRTSEAPTELSFAPAFASSKSEAVDIDDYLQQLDSDNEAQSLLSDGRKWVAEQYYEGELSIRALRLRLGLSQTQLAKKMETSQARISKIEAGGEDVRRSTIKSLASALGVSPEDVFNALEQHDE